MAKEEPKVIWEDEHISVMLKGPGWIVAFSRDEEQSKGLVSLLKKKGTLEPRGLVDSGEPEHFCHYLMLKYTDDMGYFLSSSIENQFGIAHRLDLETSGALMLGRTETGFSHLRRAFMSHEVFKEYICLVHGAMKDDHGEVVFPIVWDESTNQSYISEHGQWAKSMYTVLGRYRLKRGKKIFSLCRVVIVTGRTHQIRLHMASLGHPLVSDSKYNKKNLTTDVMWCPRLFLHAWRLRFMDVGRIVREVKAPLTKDLTRSLRTLEEVYLDLSKSDNPSLRTAKPPAKAAMPPIKEQQLVAGARAEGAPLVGALGADDRRSRPDPRAPPAPADHSAAGAAASPWRPLAQPGGPLGDASTLEWARNLVAVSGGSREDRNERSPPGAGQQTAPRPPSSRPTVREGAHDYGAASADDTAQQDPWQDAAGGKLDALVAMGFDRAQAAQALLAKNDDFFKALDQLAAGGPPGAMACRAPSKEASSDVGAVAAAASVARPAEGAGAQDEDLRKVLELSQKEDEERRRQEKAREAQDAELLRQSIEASKLEALEQAEEAEQLRQSIEASELEARQQDDAEEEALHTALEASKLEQERLRSLGRSGEEELLKVLRESVQMASEQQRRQELEEEELERVLRESIRDYEAFFSEGEDYDLEEILRQSLLDAHGHALEGAAASSSSSLGGLSAGADEDGFAASIQESYNCRYDFDDEDEVVLFGHQGSSLTPFEREIASQASSASSASRWLADATAALLGREAPAPLAACGSRAPPAAASPPPAASHTEAPPAAEVAAAVAGPAPASLVASSTPCGDAAAAAAAPAATPAAGGPSGPPPPEPPGGGKQPADTVPAAAAAVPTTVLGGRRGRWAMRAKS